jgi:hypothetical protein
MMKRFATLLIGACALASQPANATTYSPTGSWVFEGTADVYRGIQLTCDVTITVNTTATSATATTSFAGGFSGLCLAYQYGLNNGPYDVVFDSATSTLTIKDVPMKWGNATCLGDLSAVWNDGDNSLLINDTIEEGEAGSGDCVVSNGYLTLTSPGDVTIS